METLQGLELVVDTGRKGTDSDVTDISEKVLNTNLLGLLSFDY